MRLWEGASLVFFCYLGLVAPTAARTCLVRLVVGTAAGLALAALSIALPHLPAVHDLLLPPILLLIGYWTSGLLFVAPRPAQEALLTALDGRLGIIRFGRHLPRWLAGALELAYLGVYPLIPIALFLHVTFATVPDAERFWAVILITDYICFGAMPFVQTRPPRALEGGAPWDSRLRSLNVGVLKAASVQVNTFPSGHAAEALACLLLTTEAPPTVVVAMALAALGVSAGAVFGRYHYLLDVLAGWAVALGVWIWLQ